MLAAPADSSRHDTPGPTGVLQTRMSAYRPFRRRYGRELPLAVPLMTADHVGQREDALMTGGHG
jgi:hypothetical protein